MSAHLQPGEADTTTTPQLACQNGSTAFEGRIREMIIGHGSQHHSSLSDSTLHQQLHAVSHSPTPQAVTEPAQQQPGMPKPEGTASQGSGKSRSRSGKSPSQRREGLNRKAAGAKPSSLADAPLPYSTKPVQHSQRQQAPKSAQQSASSSNAAALSTQAPTVKSGPHTQTVKAHPSAPRQRQARGRYPTFASHETPQDQAPFPFQTILQQGSYPRPPQSSAYGRPLPRHQQLYNPYSQPTQNHQQPWFHSPGFNNYSSSQVAIQAQVAYLDAIAREEIPKVRISQEEEQQKETMRIVLEDICQHVITEHEIQRDALFDGSTVSLKCYGSLRTGFATQSSDMDLALESPRSKPDVSSAESDIPRLLERALLDLGYGARLLTRTRIPLIRFCEKPTPELTMRLREERQRWEKEKDSQPEAKRARKKVDEKFKPPKTEDKKDPTDGGTQDDLPDVGMTSSDRSSATRNTDEASLAVLHSQSSRCQADTFQSTQTCNTKAVQGSQANETSPDRDPINVGQLSLSDVRAPTAQPMSETTTLAAVKERRERVLPDDELVRLYKLAIKEGWFEPHERKTIFNFFNAVERNDNADQVAECRAQLLSLPDVLNRYRPPPEHHLDYPTDGVGMQCDIIFSNPLAVHNSAMLRCYNLSDPRVKPMVLFIKAWARRRKINSPYHGTLSSYGYVLMVLHYLVNVTRPAICLNLQAIDMAARDASVENTQIIEGYGVRFWRNESEIQQWARNGRITADRHSTVGSLLRGFFQYFAVSNGGFSWGMDVLSLRTPGGILPKSEKGWIAAKTEVLDPSVEGQRGQGVRQRYLFAIEDPFEINHNIARTVVHNGIVAIRDEFRRANKLVHEARNGKTTENLFAEADSKNDLNYRHFGPRPKPPQSKEAGQAAKSKSGQSVTGFPDPPDSSAVSRVVDHTLTSDAPKESPSVDGACARQDVATP
ncbi:MAG: hypothetical protein Q9225_005987 [Loekoesia sp. 1 TL-2023]